MNAQRLHQALLLMLLLTAAAVCLAREVPYLSGRVVDDAEILTAEARALITELSRQHEEKTSNQLAVLTVATLESQSIEEFAVQVFEKWQLGQQGKDNGVLLLIAPQERRMRIEVGYGLEGTLPDVIASRIIRAAVAPQFKNGNYDAGVIEGVRAMVTVLEGGATPAAQSAPRAAPAPRAPPLIGDLDLPSIFIRCMVFGLLGVFTVTAVRTPGPMGWILYVLMAPFWVMFPLAVVGVSGMLMAVGIYLVTYPAIKVLLSRSGWYEKMTDSHTKGAAGMGGFGSGSSWSSRAWSLSSSRNSRSSSSSRSSRSFRGGGGRSGGGGASGSW